MPSPYYPFMSLTVPLASSALEKKKKKKAPDRRLRQYGISALVSRKAVVASRNVGYFLKLGRLYLDLRSRLDIVVA